MTMDPQTARDIQRPPIIVGNQYTFFAEMQQEYEPPHKRMRRYTGTLVTVIRNLDNTEYDGPGPDDTDDDNFEVSRAFEVEARDGTRFTAMIEEINDWDRDLGQYFWPDATYGPDHDTLFLGNETANKED